MLYQPNITFSMSLTNDPSMTKRCLLIQNKDKIATTIEQYVEAVKDWNALFREQILKSDKIYQEDLEAEFPAVVSTFTMSAKGEIAILLFESTEQISDPNLCEALYTWMNNLSEKLKGGK